ncbi:cysteine dioxygenase [Shimazuella kribbensis]|uniref:cysteine dioxygenase n=1 Tax=Shimazuella kribbensis TaxID=139808 RepID=UPI00041E48C6|nr:cysteine dioxygenase family protein [Shimazuella kribbensis]
MELTTSLSQMLKSKIHPAVTQVEKLIRDIDCTYQQVIPYITSPTATLNYGRNVIYQTPIFEVIVLNLPSFTATPIHDHGESFCCVRIMKGELHNRLFGVSSTSESPHLLKTEIYTTLDYFTVTNDQIHSMYNPNAESLITFHIYAPPIKNNHIFKMQPIKQ